VDLFQPSSTTLNKDALGENDLSMSEMAIFQQLSATMRVHELLKIVQFAESNIWVPPFEHREGWGRQFQTDWKTLLRR